MKNLLSWLAISLASFAGAQDVGKPFDYETRAAALQSVLKQLQDKTSVKLTCDPALAQEPLILRIHQVPLKEVMDKIAGVFAAEWSKKGDDYILQRSKSAEAIHEHEVARRAGEIAKSIDARLIEIPALQISTPEEAARLVSKPTELSETLRTQRERLTLQVVKKLDATALVDVPTGTRIVYSTDPTTLQLPLPDSLQEIGNFLQAQTLLRSAVIASTLSESQKRDFISQLPASDAATTLLTIYVNLDSSYDAELAFFDANGQQIARFKTQFGQRFLFSEHKRQEDALRNKIENGVQLGPVAKAIWPFLSPKLLATAKPIPNDIATILQSPTKNDPLSFATTDLAFGLADAEKLNVVYAPTDYGESWAQIATSGGATNFDLFKAVLDRARETVVSKEDGWLIGKPADPLDATASRLSRSSLEEFERACLDNGYPDDFVIGNLELQGTPYTNHVLATYALSTFFKTDIFAWTAVDDWEARAFLATLDDSQTQIAASNVLKIDSKDLSSDQADRLTAWACNRQVQFSDLAPAQGSALWKESTICLANGIPEGSRVELTDRVEKGYLVPIDRSTKNEKPIDVEELARMVAERESSPGINYDFSSIQIQPSRFITLSLILPTNARIDQVLSQEVKQPSAPARLEDVLNAMTAEDRGRYEAALSKTVGKSPQ